MKLAQYLPNLPTYTERGIPPPPTGPVDEGEPDCETCQGAGYLRWNVPIEDHRFGKMKPCRCTLALAVARYNDELATMSNLLGLADKTLDGFETRTESQRKALEAARQFVTNPGDDKPWLILTGNFGTGKTHLAAAIAADRIRQARRVLFMGAPRLLAQLRATYNSDSEVTHDDLVERCILVELLILDDFGAQKDTEWAQEQLYIIINERYAARRELIVTTNVSSAQMEPRVRSRLNDWQVSQIVHLTDGDFRAKSQRG